MGITKSTTTDKRKKGYVIGAAILVGGRSTRMGSPKENVIIRGDGRTFLNRICDEVDSCFGNCIFSRYLSIRKGQEISRAGYVCVEDKYDDIGPLGGIISVLKRAEDDGVDAVIFIACDMIKYDRKEICSICGIYKGEDILWARTGGENIQPLASIYSTSMIKAATDMADKRNYRIRDIGKSAANTAFYDSGAEIKYKNVNEKADL